MMPYSFLSLLDSVTNRANSVGEEWPMSICSRATLFPKQKSMAQNSILLHSLILTRLVLPTRNVLTDKKYSCLGTACLFNRSHYETCVIRTVWHYETYEKLLSPTHNLGRQSFSHMSWTISGQYLLVWWEWLFWFPITARIEQEIIISRGQQ